jgi:hypothetical protein
VPLRNHPIHADEYTFWFQSEPGDLTMIIVSILTLTIYLFGFLGSPREQRIASAARTVCQKLANNKQTHANQQGDYP